MLTSLQNFSAPSRALKTSDAINSILLHKNLVLYPYKERKFTIFVSKNLRTMKKVEIDGIFYNLSDGQAEVTSKANGKYTGSVGIPESVMYEDKVYVVTSIDEFAFFEML